MHRPFPEDGEPPTVLLFIASDCPVANGYAPSITAIRRDYANEGVRFFLVNVEGKASKAELLTHANEYELAAPILLDHRHKLARRVAATVTPEAVVIRPGGAIAYRGRIDDRYPDLGVRRPKATTSELRDALDAVLAGREVAVPAAAAVGCLIEDWAP
ncbi:MAG: redoxin domain-containing protein [Planctomycetota bacterium]